MEVDSGTYVETWRGNGFYLLFSTYTSRFLKSVDLVTWTSHDPGGKKVSPITYIYILTLHLGRLQDNCVRKRRISPGNVGDAVYIL